MLTLTGGTLDYQRIQFGNSSYSINATIQIQENTTTNFDAQATQVVDNLSDDNSAIFVYGNLTIKSSNPKSNNPGKLTINKAEASSIGETPSFNSVITAQSSNSSNGNITFESGIVDAKCFSGHKNEDD